MAVDINELFLLFLIFRSIMNKKHRFSILFFQVAKKQRRRVPNKSIIKKLPWAA